MVIFSAGKYLKILSHNFENWKKKHPGSKVKTEVVSIDDYMLC